MSAPAVLVLSRDAADYLPLLGRQLHRDVPLRAACTVRQAVDGGEGESVVLGEPDLVAAALPELPGIRWVQSSWAGVTPLLDCGRRDFLLTGIKGVFGLQMAQYVMAYLLAHEVRILERLGKQAEKAWWDRRSGSLHGKTLGVMGTGSIGSAIAAAAGVFGMALHGYSRSGRPVQPFDRVYAAGQLEQFLPPLDYLVAVLPDTPDTRHLLSGTAFSLMKPGSYLVNVGRGSLVDERALHTALTDGELGGAVLDVFEAEPLPQQSPLWHTPNLLVTGHIAAVSHPRDIARIFSQNYRKYISHEPLDFLIDFERGY